MNRIGNRWRWAIFACGLIIPAITAGGAFAHDDLRLLARQGLMAAMQLDANILYAMAKGETRYDPDVAEERAARLQRLAGYDMESLFASGTSTEDKPGETRSLPQIWAEPEKFAQGFSSMRAAIDAVAAKAGAGADEMSAAAIELGKTCGGCHRAYRARDSH